VKLQAPLSLGVKLQLSLHLGVKLQAPLALGLQLQLSQNREICLVLRTLRCVGLPS
jgi:hypothetical protein